MSEPARPGPSTPADPRTNTLVKRVLRTGLGISLVLLLSGLITQLVSGHDRAIQVKMFDLLAPESTGEKLMAFGMLALTLTPALGVLTVLVSWLRERDTTFVIVGVVVTAVLATSVIVGLTG